MEFGMSRKIKTKEKYVRISIKEIWRNLDGSPKHLELWSYVVSFEFSRTKVDQSRKEGNVLFIDAINWVQELIMLHFCLRVCVV